MRAKEFEKPAKNSKDTHTIKLEDDYSLRKLSDWNNRENRTTISTIFSQHYHIPPRELWNEIVKYPPKDSRILVYGLYHHDNLVGFCIFRRESLDSTFDVSAHPEVNDWAGRGLEVLASALIVRSNRKKLLQSFLTIPQKLDYDYVWAPYYESLPTIGEFLDASGMVPLFKEMGPLGSYVVLAKSFSNPLLNRKYKEIADQSGDEDELEKQDDRIVVKPEPKKAKLEPQKPESNPLAPLKPLDTIKGIGGKGEHPHHHKKHDKDKKNQKPRYNYKVLEDYVNESIQSIPYLDDSDIADYDYIFEAMIDQLILDQAKPRKTVTEADVTPMSYYHGDTRNPFWGLYINGKLKFRYSARSEALKVADEYSQQFPQDKVEVRLNRGAK